MSDYQVIRFLPGGRVQLRSQSTGEIIVARVEVGPDGTLRYEP